MPWSEKYRPKSLKEFINQEEVVKKFLSWIKQWKPGQKILLFYGPSGVGKTCLVQAYADQTRIEFIELNASDYRSAKQIRDVIGQAMSTSSLLGKGKIFLIDEVDGIAGKEDVGGVREMIKMIKEARYPIILTANDPFAPKLRSLRQYCELIAFKKLHTLHIERRLREICEKEGIEADKPVLRAIAKDAKGDLRAAINDLEVLAQEKKKITLKDLEVLGYREKEVSIFDALKLIFKTKSAQAAKLSLANVEKDPDEIFWWVEENIFNEYEKPEEIVKALEALSKADLFKRRIIRTQNWRLMAYMLDLMSAGVALAKKETYKKFTKYRYPSRLITLGSTKQERAELKVLLEKLSKVLHCSTKTIKQEYLKFLKFFLKQEKVKKNLMKTLNLSEQELNLLIKF